MPLSTGKRWSKEAKITITVPCPSLIPAYNQHMGGIDLSDMLVHLYKTPAKSRRWYIPLFGCISNSWLVYKRDCVLLNEKPKPLKRLRLAVAHSLMSQQARTQSWQTIDLLSTTSEETPKTLTTTTRCAL
ncbi:hypothetical protein VZT92_000120 [Zoarces viviparus]|uniref:PiggyBac transposable element-derived protein domain-containing protein n=1 Tax=Zoarces viviparus TaxID=48416 RepID=A0AAW1G6T8_ZOAVI